MNKKLLIGLLFVAGFAGAACFGPFCYDDSGLTIRGVTSDGNGTGLPSLTKAQMQAAKPKAAGMAIYCSDCTVAPVCVSSGTTLGGYVVAMSTSTVPVSLLHCQ